MSKDASYYAIIPANVRYDKELCPNAKLLYGEISALCKKEGYCWSSNDYFAELYDVSKKSISTWISQLVNSSYIQKQIVYKQGTKEILMRKLYISDGFKITKNKEEILPTPMEEKFHDPMEEKFSNPTEEKVKDKDTSSSLIIQGRKDGKNVQTSTSISPNDLETDGIEKHPTELPKPSTTSKSSGGGLNLKTSNIQSPHAPIDIAKVGRDMFELLRKKFPKDEMDNFLNSVDIDLPTLSNMFAEYWVFEKKRTFNKGESTGVFNSFRSWMSIAKGKEIPEKEVVVGLHSNDRMAKLIPAIEKRKIIKLTPQDAQKVNAFIREFNPSDWALFNGTQSFFDGNGREWDHWISAVKGAIGREQMGEL